MWDAITATIAAEFSDVADLEQSDLARVDRREGVRHERVEARLVDLHVEDAATAGRHGHRLHAVQRVLRVHVGERVGRVEDRPDDVEVAVERGPGVDDPEGLTVSLPIDRGLTWVGEPRG